MPIARSGQTAFTFSPATRSLFAFLARIARSQRLAIVGTYQPDAIRRDDPWSVDLDQLGDARRERVAAGLAPEGATGDDHAARVHEHIAQDDSRAGAARNSSMAKPIVTTALFGIRQNAVRLGGFLELFFRRSVVRIFVRMVFNCEPPVGALNLLFRGGAAHGKHFVIITFAAHSLYL